MTDESHPDLMWALRGGGGNFGVAASLVYRLHPLGMVTGGLIAHPIDAAGDMLRFYRDAVADCPDDLTVFAGRRARAGRLGLEARGDGRLPHRRPGRRRARPRAVQGLGLAARWSRSGRCPTP